MYTYMKKEIPVTPVWLKFLLNTSILYFNLDIKRERICRGIKMTFVRKFHLTE